MDPRLRAYAVRQVAFFTLSATVMFVVAGRLDWLAEVDAHDWELAKSEPRAMGPADREPWTLPRIDEL